VLLDYFERLETEPQQWDVRYVLTLLLVRRRLLRVERTVTDARDQEQLVVYCSRSEREHRVAVVMPNDDRAREIQSQLTALLFGDPAARPLVNPGAPAEGTLAVMESAAVESVAVESVAVESVAVESVAVESVAVESVAVESVAVESDEMVVPEPAVPEPEAGDSANTRSAA
jgi:hypothetical protein